MMDRNVANSTLQSQNDKRNAEIFIGNTQKPFGVQKVVIPLDTARLETQPMKFTFPFQCLYVQDATDSGTIIKFKPGTQDSYQSDFNLSEKDVWSSGSPTTESIFFWDAQPGKSITIVFFANADFKSGSQISQTSGGVTISEGSIAQATARTQLSATTAAAIVPANPDRKMCLIENATGADIFISGANTVTNSGATRGIKVAAGDYIEWKNTAILYGYSVAGGDIHYMEQE